MTFAAKKDEYVGRMFESLGALLDNDDLRTRGRRQRSAARVKEATGEVRKAVDDVTDRIVKGKGRKTSR